MERCIVGRDGRLRCLISYIAVVFFLLSSSVVVFSLVCSLALHFDDHHAHVGVAVCRRFALSLSFSVLAAFVGLPGLRSRQCYTSFLAAVLWNNQFKMQLAQTLAAE